MTKFLMSTKKSKSKLTLTKTLGPAPSYKQVTLPHILPWCSLPKTKAKMSQSLGWSGGSGSGVPCKVTVAKTQTNLQVIIKQEDSDVTYTFDLSSTGHLRIMQFFNRIGAYKLIEDNPDLSSILLTKIFTDLDGAPSQDVSFHTVNPKHFQEDVLVGDIEGMHQPSSPAVRSLQPFA